MRLADPPVTPEQEPVPEPEPEAPEPEPKDVLGNVEALLAACASVDEAFANWDRAIAEMKAAVPMVIAEEVEESPSEGAEGFSEERKGSPSAAPPVLEMKRMRAEITAEV